MEQGFVLQKVGDKTGKAPQSPPSTPNPPTAPNPSTAGLESPGNTAMEFWKVAHAKDATASEPLTGMGSMPAFSQPAAPVNPASTIAPPRRTATYALIGLGFALIAWVGVATFILEIDPLDPLTSLLSSEDPATDTASAPPPPSLPKVLPPVELPTRMVEGNPYWHLPNLLPPVSASTRMWNLQEEEQWRQRLQHRFPWQRLKAVKDIRDQRLRGSEAALWTALNDKKLWTRMSAVIGLAEGGFEVPLDAMDQALGREREDLVANYFERYVARSSEAERYIMKQSIRLAPDKARLTILRALVHAGDPDRDLYLVASSLDPSPRVQRWWSSLPARAAITPEAYERDKNLIVNGFPPAGVTSQEEVVLPTKPANPTPPAESAPQTAPIVEELPPPASPAGAPETVNANAAADAAPPPTAEPLTTEEVRFYDESTLKNNSDNVRSETVTLPPEK